MEGKSHRVGGVVAALSGYLLLKENGILLERSVADPALQFMVIYVSGYYGGIWPDNDHHWESSPLKDPLSFLQNKVLHLANPTYKRLDATLHHKYKKQLSFRLIKLLACRHRSWQTHSEFTLLGILMFFGSLTSILGYTPFNQAISWLLMLGFFLGVVSHLVLDALTTEGIRFGIGIWTNALFDWKLPETLRLVPKVRYFSTGSPWELAIRKWLQVFQYILITLVILDFLNIKLF